MKNQPLDPSVVALTKAIGSSESDGNYSAVGKSGEYGAYQYTAPTWAADSQKYLGSSIPLEQATPAQQDEVAYKKVEDLGKQGYKPDQIASIWNSGKPDYQGNVGTNKYGVHYDTPAYVKSVGANYEKIMNGGQAQPDPNNPSNVPNTSNNSRKSFVDSIKDIPGAETSTPSNDALSTAGNVSKGLLDITGGNTIADYAATQHVKDNILNGTNGAAEVDYSKLTPDSIARLKAKGVPTTLQGQRQETANQVESPSKKALLSDIGKTGLSIAGLVGGGAALDALLESGTALGSTVAKEALTNAIGPGESISDLSALEKSEALSTALKESDNPGEQTILKDALKELEPVVKKEAGYVPNALQKLNSNAGSGLLKLAKNVPRTALDIAGIGSIGNIIKGLFAQK